MLSSHVVLASLAACASAAVNVTLCSDSQCYDTPLGSYRLDESSIGQCFTHHAGEALAIKVNEWHDEQIEGALATTTANNNIESILNAYTGPSLDVRFYRSVDCFGHCGSGHLIIQMVNGFKTLVRGPRRDPAGGSVLQSFEIVQVDENYHYGPHGYCGIRHGDAVFLRGRNWKWQQIGHGTFREVPIEQWSDNEYPALDGEEYDMHGSVGSDGKTKWHQIALEAWTGVPVEEWDDEVHVRIQN